MYVYCSFVGAPLAIDVFKDSFFIIFLFKIPNHTYELKRILNDAYCDRLQNDLKIRYCATFCFRKVTTIWTRSSRILNQYDLLPKSARSAEISPDVQDWSARFVPVALKNAHRNIHVKQRTLHKSLRVFTPIDLHRDNRAQIFLLYTFFERTLQPATIILV